MLEDENEQIAQRRAKLETLRQSGTPYRNDFRRDSTARQIHEAYDALDQEALEQKAVRVSVAGRMMTRRLMGKASFAHLQDMTGQIQLYVQKNALAEGDYAEFKIWDIGDILGASGTVFKTKTGELSVRVEQIHLLTKALRPLPDKYHGLVDQELRYRQAQQDQDVDIGIGVQLAPAISPYGDQGDVGVVCRDEVAPGPQQQLVHQPGVLMDQYGHRFTAVEALIDCGVARIQGGAEQCHRVVGGRQLGIEAPAIETPVEAFVPGGACHLVMAHDSVDN